MYKVGVKRRHCRHRSMLRYELSTTDSMICYPPFLCISIGFHWILYLLLPSSPPLGTNLHKSCRQFSGSYYSTITQLLIFLQRCRIIFLAKLTNKIVYSINSAISQLRVFKTKDWSSQSLNNLGDFELALNFTCCQANQFRYWSVLKPSPNIWP